jgi:hypothetical protein
VLGDQFNAHLYARRVLFRESQPVNPLPALRLESEEEIIFQADEIDLFSYDGSQESSKIQVIDDPRSYESLCKLFQHLPQEFVSKVWITQTTWGGSFDILSTLRCCSFSLTFIFDPVADPTTWPTLQVAYPRKLPNFPAYVQQRSRSNSEGSFLFLRNSDLDSHHEVISLSNSSLSGFSWHICPPPQEAIPGEEEIRSEASWEMLPDDQDETSPNHQPALPPADDDDVSVLTLPPPVTTFFKSFKDALLTGGFDYPPPPSTCLSHSQPRENFCPLTLAFAQQADVEPYEYLYEDDTYEDWLETALGSKVTSIAAINRGRSHSAKATHERKKALFSYTRKHARR